MQPIDIKLDKDFDINSPPVRKALGARLSECHLVSTAMDCSTKSRIREIAIPGRRSPKPLRSEEHPRGLPNLAPADAARVQADNAASDFVLAIQTVMHEHGRGAFRENPRRSYHWSDPVEEHLHSQGCWDDWSYDNCCLMATRRKKQRIRHNLEEYSKLPTLTCAHHHHEQEWRPIRKPDGMYYPSSEESEYTAALSFSLAVAASYWAVRQGFAILRLGSMPKIECAGDRVGWLELPPSTFREDAMIPTAIQCGYSPQHGKYKQLPSRVQVLDVWDKEQGLPEDVVYAGHGHFRHRLPCSQWCNPFKVGRDGTPVAVLLMFIADIEEFLSSHDLHQLMGKRIACDCHVGQPCHVDVLIAKAFEALEQRSHSTRRSPWLGPIRMIRATPVAFSQAAIVAGIQSQFPDVTFFGVSWPPLEHLVNDPVLTRFRSWAGQQPIASDGPLGPEILQHVGVIGGRAALAEQSGAGPQRAALPPVVPFGLSPEMHFQCCLELHEHNFPMEAPQATDWDLRFAAECMAEATIGMNAVRTQATRVIKQLAQQLDQVSQYLRAQQHPEVRKVNPSVHLALIAVLILVLHWPDTTLCSKLFRGFEAIGHVPACGIWGAQQVEYISQAKLLEGAVEDGRQLLQSLRSGPDDQVILDAGAADETKQWCTPERPVTCLAQEVGGYRLIKRFVITQNSGKKRVIDDAAAGGQSRLSQDGNHLKFCSALQPCTHLKCLEEAMQKRGKSILQRDYAVSTIGEDLPDAYRKIPMLPAHSQHCLVTYWHKERRCAMYRRYHSMLFGLPLAVSAFNRVSSFLQAVARRILCMLCSLYFDDATAQDFDGTALVAQQSLEQVAEAVGFPFSEEKRQPPTKHGDFLGVVHDLDFSHRKPFIKLWIRPKLLAKIHDLINTSFLQRSLAPGIAAKLFGCLTFLSHAAFGKVARSGLVDIKERQYASTSELTPELANALRTVQQLLHLEPNRLVPVFQSFPLRLIGASDAAHEGSGLGTGGFLFVNPQGRRLGSVVHITQEVQQLWGNQAAIIAQLELLMVLQAALQYPNDFRGSACIWFCDNIASLMSLVKGRSDVHSLDHMSRMIHLLMFQLRCHAWYEWIPSASNWSDGISRTGFHDPFWKAHRFHVSASYICTLLWHLDLPTLTHVFSFL